MRAFKRLLGFDLSLIESFLWVVNSLHLCFLFYNLNHKLLSSSLFNPDISSINHATGTGDEYKRDILQKETDNELALFYTPEEKILFHFDHIFMPESTQEELYETTAKDYVLWVRTSHGSFLRCLFASLFPRAWENLDKISGHLWTIGLDTHGLNLSFVDSVGIVGLFSASLSKRDTTLRSWHMDRLQQERHTRFLGQTWTLLRNGASSLDLSGMRYSHIHSQIHADTLMMQERTVEPEMDLFFLCHFVAHTWWYVGHSSEIFSAVENDMSGSEYTFKLSSVEIYKVRSDCNLPSVIHT
jgi:hypothetical protein